MYILQIFVNIFEQIKKLKIFFIILLDTWYFIVYFLTFLGCFSILSIYIGYEENNLLLDLFQGKVLGPLGINLRASVLCFLICCCVLGSKYDTLGPNYWSFDRLNYSQETVYGYSRALEDFKKIEAEWNLDYETYLTGYFFKRQMIDPGYKSNFIHSFQDSDFMGEGVFGLWMSMGLAHIIFCLLFLILLHSLGEIYQYIFWSRQERLSYQYNKLYYQYLGNLPKLSGITGFYNFLGDLYSKELYKYSLEEKSTEKIKAKGINNDFYYGEVYIKFNEVSRNLMLKNFYLNHVYGGYNQKFLVNQEHLSTLGNYGIDFGLENKIEEIYLPNYFNNFEGQFLRGGLECFEDKRSSFDFLISEYFFGYGLSINQYSESSDSLAYYYGKESLEGQFGDFINFFVGFISQLNVAVVYDDNIDDLGESLSEGSDAPAYIYDEEDRSDHTFGWSYELDKCLDEYGRSYNETWWISRSSLGISLGESKFYGLSGGFNSSFLKSEKFEQGELSRVRSFKSMYLKFKSNRSSFSLGDVMGTREGEHDGVKKTIGSDFFSKGWLVLIQGTLFCLLFLIDEQDDYFWEAREGVEYPVYWLGLLDSFRMENIDLFYYNYFPELECFFYSQDFYEEEYELYQEEMLDEEMPDMEIVDIDFSTFDLINMFSDLKVFYVCFIIFMLKYLEDLYLFCGIFSKVYYFYVFSITGISISYWLNLIFLGFVISVVVSFVYKYFVNYGFLLKYKSKSKKLRHGRV